MLNELITRLEKIKILTSSGCWETNLKPESNGYCRISIQHTHYLIHRISAAHYLKLNLENENELALHKNECNNRKCWNPEHLYIGDKRDNIRDAVLLGTSDIGKFQRSKIKCPKGHEYTKDNTIYHSKTGARMCKECRKWKNQKKYYNK